MNNFFPTVYAPVKVSERLPEKTGIYFVKDDSGENTAYYGKKYFNDDTDLWSRNYPGGDPVVKEWLEPLENRYIFTKEELEKLLSHVLKTFGDDVTASYSESNSRNYIQNDYGKLKSQQ